MSFAQPFWLWLLPLAAALAWWRRGSALPHSALDALPRDPASDALQFVLRAAAVLAVLGCVVGIAGPYRPEASTLRIGRGAEIVLLLDRSRSMDQGFARSTGRPRPSGTGPETLEYYARLRADEARQSKGKVARELLGEFAAKRPRDRFGMVVFSTLPIPVLGFTQKPEAIQAAIRAGDIGRGLAETHIGLALQSALGFFADRPFTGSRIVMLVSDGGDRIDVDAREQLTRLFRDRRVSLYWIYIRSARSPGLTPPADDNPASAESVPEYMLHRFFESLGTPYRAYEAENPEALQKAIDDVDRLENLPITYADTVPRQDLSAFGYGVALAAVLTLLAASMLELRPWR